MKSAAPRPQTTRPGSAGAGTFLVGHVETDPDTPHQQEKTEASRRGEAAIEQALVSLDCDLIPNRDEGGVIASFPRAADAAAGALAAQRALHDADDGRGHGRIALHTPAPELRERPEHAEEAIARCIQIGKIAQPGQVLLSRWTHDLIVDVLPDGASLVDLGLHRLRDPGRAEHVFGLAHPELAVEYGELRSLDGLPNNLPDQLTSFIGRMQEREEIRKALGATRLLTLTGAGGCGKTRLALQVAAEALDRFPDGAWWVDLAPLAQHESVADAVAEVFEVRPLPGMTSLQAVSGHLSPREALLVLDNCEHVLESSGEVAEQLLQAAPGVTVMATSRASLTIAGEADWRVPSLSVPGADGDSVAALEESDAARLFTARAAQTDSAFELTSQNAPAVSQICRELDGIPLALELAAARIQLLSSREIADGLADRFRLLGSGSLRAVPRHQTLGASIDWSHDLLDPRERTLLRRLAVFAGGWTRAAAEQVCSDEALPEAEILDALGSLAGESLVLVEKRGERVRYRLLETVRQYADDRLTESGEWDRLHDRHRDHFLDVAEEAAPHLGRVGEREWFDLLDIETANMASAFDRAVGGSAELALRFDIALNLWRRARRPLNENEAAYARSLAAAEADAPGPRARVLWARAYNAIGGGETEAAEIHATDALALAEEAGDKSTAARALCALGLTEGYVRPAAGRSQLRRAADFALEAEDDWAQVEAAQFEAFTFLFQDRHAEIERAIAGLDDLTDEIGEGEQLARRALIRGSVGLLDGDLDGAQEILEAAMAEIDADPSVEAWVEAQLALIDVFRGAPDAAVTRLHALLEVAMESGGGLAIPALLIWTAFAEVSQGMFEASRDRLKATISIIDGRDCLLTLWAYWLLAENLRMLGADDAQQAAERAVAFGEQVGNRLGKTRASLTLARLAAARGEWATAERHALEHLDVCAEGHATFIPSCLDALAESVAGLDSHEEAVRLFGAAARARDDLGVARWTPEDEHWASIEEGLRAVLGSDAHDSAWDEGHELGTTDALAWARRARGSRKRPPGGWESLTPTESKVVELVAEGLTNPQVAEKMFVSRATVKTHLSHIYRKLDVGGRAELAAEAVRRQI